MLQWSTKTPTHDLASLYNAGDNSLGFSFSQTASNDHPLSHPTDSSLYREDALKYQAEMLVWQILTFCRFLSLLVQNDQLEAVMDENRLYATLKAQKVLYSLDKFYKRPNYIHRVGSQLFLSPLVLYLGQIQFSCAFEAIIQRFDRFYPPVPDLALLHMDTGNSIFYVVPVHPCDVFGNLTSPCEFSILLKEEG